MQLLCVPRHLPISAQSIQDQQSHLFIGHNSHSNSSASTTKVPGLHGGFISCLLWDDVLLEFKRQKLMTITSYSCNKHHSFLIQMSLLIETEDPGEETSSRIRAKYRTKHNNIAPCTLIHSVPILRPLFVDVFNEGVPKSWETWGGYRVYRIS